MFLSLKEILDYLNAFRVISAADNYFGGREILKAESTNIFVISDFMDDEFLNVSSYLHTKKNPVIFFVLKKKDHTLGPEYQFYQFAFERCL